MQKNVYISTNIRTEEILESISRFSQEDGIEFIKELEKCYEDWEVTEQLARYFVSEMSKLYKEDPEDAKNWNSFLIANTNKGESHE